MADGDGQGTTPPNPDGTDGGVTPPAATPPVKDSGAATGGDETITLKKTDYNNLVSQRDKGNQTALEQDEFVQTLAKERAIDTFLKDNKDKFPDVNQEDLSYATTAEEVEEIAGRTQKRFDEVAQRKLMDVQRTTAPVLSPDQRAEKLKALKGKNQPKDAFEQMVAIRSTATS